MIGKLKRLASLIKPNKRLTRLTGYDVELVRIRTRYIPGLITNEYSVHLFTLLHLVPLFVSEFLCKHRPNT